MGKANNKEMTNATRQHSCIKQTDIWYPAVMLSQVTIWEQEAFDKFSVFVLSMMSPYISPKTITLQHFQ